MVGPREEARTEAAEGGKPPPAGPPQAVGSLDPTPPGPSRATWAFEWTVVVLCAWLMSGAYLDAWAHRHLARLETFFTPWHAALYSGIANIPEYSAACHGVKNCLLYTSPSPRD